MPEPKTKRQSGHWLRVKAWVPSDRKDLASQAAAIGALAKAEDGNREGVIAVLELATHIEVTTTAGTREVDPTPAPATPPAATGLAAGSVNTV